TGPHTTRPARGNLGCASWPGALRGLGLETSGRADGDQGPLASDAICAFGTERTRDGARFPVFPVAVPPVAGGLTGCACRPTLRCATRDASHPPGRAMTSHHASLTSAWRCAAVLNGSLAVLLAGAWVFLGLQGLFWKADFSASYTGWSMVLDGHGGRLYDIEL